MKNLPNYVTDYTAHMVRKVRLNEYQYIQDVPKIYNTLKNAGTINNYLNRPALESMLVKIETYYQKLKQHKLEITGFANTPNFIYSSNQRIYMDNTTY